MEAWSKAKMAWQLRVIALEEKSSIDLSIRAASVVSFILLNAIQLFRFSWQHFLYTTFVLLLCKELLHFVNIVCFIQVLKVEENTLSHYAELEILDSTICKAKAMKINFQPVKCPTQVRIHFDGAKE